MIDRDRCWPQGPTVLAPALTHISFTRAGKSRISGASASSGCFGGTQRTSLAPWENRTRLRREGCPGQYGRGRRAHTQAHTHTGTQRGQERAAGTTCAAARAPRRSKRERGTFMCVHPRRQKDGIGQTPVAQTTGAQIVRGRAQTSCRRPCMHVAHAPFLFLLRHRHTVAEDTSFLNLWSTHGHSSFFRLALFCTSDCGGGVRGSLPASKATGLHPPRAAQTRRHRHVRQYGRSRSNRGVGHRECRGAVRKAIAPVVRRLLRLFLSFLLQHQRQLLNGEMSRRCIRRGCVSAQAHV
jgi:hypothetical protein